MDRAVLLLCNLTDNMAEPWIAAGYTVVMVDLQHPAGLTRNGNVIRYGCNILEFIPPRLNYVAAFAFPPCTDLAVSGARWFPAKGLKSLANALLLVDKCRELCEWTGAPWWLENPVSTISTYWRKPDFMFDPCDYAGYLDDPTPEAYTKRTCLWAGGGFEMPPPKRVEPVLGSKMHKLPPSAERANIRSITPKGFAMAVFLAMHGLTPSAPAAVSAGEEDTHE